MDICERERFEDVDLLIRTKKKAGAVIEFSIEYGRCFVIIREHYGVRVKRIPVNMEAFDLLKQVHESAEL